MVKTERSARLGGLGLLSIRAGEDGILNAG
jgi:hypothetical protein